MAVGGDAAHASTYSHVDIFTDSNVSVKGHSLNEMTSQRCVTPRMRHISDLNGAIGLRLLTFMFRSTISRQFNIWRAEILTTQSVERGWGENM